MPPPNIDELVARGVSDLGSRLGFLIGVSLLRIEGGSTAIVEDGVATAGREHLPRPAADEQCHRHRREGIERVPERDLSGALAGRCTVQDGAGYAG